MSDPENFLARWSRRKRDAVEDAPAAPPVTPAGPPVESEHDEAKDEGKARKPAPARDVAPDKSEPAFDLSQLPSIDSITSETDIRVFLTPGVPLELARAALRRAWAADPTIRDFVGLAENAWDFTAPDAMPGFGPLEMTDELRRAVADMFGRGLATEASDKPAPTVPVPPDAPVPLETTTELRTTIGKEPTAAHRVNVGIRQDEPVNNNDESGDRDELMRRDKDHIAMQHNSKKDQDQKLVAPRSHGRALPE